MRYVQPLTFDQRRPLTHVYPFFRCSRQSTQEHTRTESNVLFADATGFTGAISSALHRKGECFCQLFGCACGLRNRRKLGARDKVQHTDEGAPSGRLLVCAAHLFLVAQLLCPRRYLPM